MDANALAKLPPATKLIDIFREQFKKQVDCELFSGTNQEVPFHFTTCKPGGFVSCCPELSVQLAAQSPEPQNLVAKRPCLLLNIETKTTSSTPSSRLNDACEELLTKFQPSPHTLLCNIGLTLRMQDNGPADFSIWLVCPFTRDATRGEDPSALSMINLVSDVDCADEPKCTTLLTACAQFMANLYKASAKVRSIVFHQTRSDFVWNTITAVDFRALQQLNGEVCSQLLAPFAANPDLSPKCSEIQAVLLRLSPLAASQFILKKTSVKEKETERYDDVLSLYTRKQQLQHEQQQQQQQQQPEQKHQPEQPEQRQQANHIEQIILISPLYPAVSYTEQVQDDNEFSATDSQVITYFASPSYITCTTLHCENIDCVFFQHMPKSGLETFLKFFTSIKDVKVFDAELVKAYIGNLLQQEKPQEQQPPIKAYVDLLFAMIDEYFAHGFAHRDVRWPNLSFWQPKTSGEKILSLFDGEFVLFCGPNLASCDSNLEAYHAMKDFYIILSYILREAETQAQIATAQAKTATAKAQFATAKARFAAAKAKTAAILKLAMEQPEGWVEQIQQLTKEDVEQVIATEEEEDESFEDFTCVNNSIMSFQGLKHSSPTAVLPACFTADCVALLLSRFPKLLRISCEAELLPLAMQVFRFMKCIDEMLHAWTTPLDKNRCKQNLTELLTNLETAYNNNIDCLSGGRVAKYEKHFARLE